MGIVGGINRAYLLAASALVSKGYVINGKRVGLAISETEQWEAIPMHRDSGKYEAGASTNKAGSILHHAANMSVLSLDAALLDKYREKARARHIIALVLNTGQTVIVGVDSPMRLTVEAAAADKPGDGIGFSLKFTCDSRSGVEDFDLVFALQKVTQVLYNGFVVNDIRGIAPDGWHIPTRAEFETLIAYLGGSAVAGGKLKKVGVEYWNDPNTLATDTYGFGLVGSGMRDHGFGYFLVKGLQGSLWTATEGDFFGANFSFYASNDSAYLSLHFRDHLQTSGFGIRLIKNDSTNTGTITDKDGNDYTTVKIGDQVWMAEDLFVKHFNNGDSIPNITDATEWMELTTPAYCTYNNE